MEIKLLITQKWNSLEHGYSNSSKLNNYLKNKILPISQLEDENYAFKSIKNYSLIENALGIKNEINLYRNLHHRYTNDNLIDENKLKLTIGRVYNVKYKMGGSNHFVKYSFVIDKTYLIIKIQRRWKKYYDKIKTKIRFFKKKPNNLLYRKLGMKYQYKEKLPFNKYESN